MKLSLLIAHSDNALGGFFRLLCAECGFDIEAASSGLECLSKLRMSRSDVLLLEQKLLWGGSDGVLALLRERNEEGAIPVILICEESAEIPAQLLAPPVVFYLRKPVRLLALMRCIRAAATISDHFPQKPRNYAGGNVGEHPLVLNEAIEPVMEAVPCLS
jgi:DNA-binding response OmpR family regulator